MKFEINCNVQEKNIARLEKWISMNNFIQSSHEKIRLNQINQEKFENWNLTLLID